MRKKYFIKIVAAVSTFCIMLGMTAPFSSAAEETEFYVSCSGDDSADGSRSAPFKTIERAKQEVRKYNRNMQNNIVVNIEPGVYYQTESIDFLPEDSGYNGYNVIYRGIDKPLVSGGIAVSGFSESAREKGVYELSLPQFKEKGVYQLYNSNGGRRQLAKTDNWIMPQGDYNSADTEYAYDGILFKKGDIPELCNVKDAEVIWYRGWNVTKFHPQSIGDIKGKTAVEFKNPEWNYYRVNNGNGVTAARSDIVCCLQNDFSLLDKPGEFYYDKSLGKLYYIPLEYEDMSNETFIIPQLETFAFFVGTKTAQNEKDSIKVRNITFEGIKFSHFACDKTYDVRFISGQGPAYSGRNKATYSNDNGAFYLNRADNINFYNNDFTEMVQTPINMRNDVSNCNIENNAFYSLSSSAIDIGATEHIERTIKEKVQYVIKKLPKTDYNMMLLNPYISASSIFNSDGSYNFASLTVMPQNSNANFYPDESFDHTSVQNLANYKYYANPGTWKGEKAWIKYDFSRKYTFSEIALAFDPEQIPSENRTGFEVLLSNDESFGTYTKVGESTSYGEIADFKVSDTEKYRYLMVRALDDKEFAVTNIYSFTPDLPHQIVRRGCNNINIKNNRIDNVACDELSNTGIFVYYCDNLNISHNEISNLPYTAISYGLSWGSYGLCGKGNISNNYIHDVNKVLYDGGAIYTLGNHSGSVVRENYIRNAAGGVGLYFDNGSCGITAENNVEEFSRATATFNSGSEKCVLDKTFTTSSRIEISDQSNNTISDAVIYNLYDKNDEVERIKNNAGVEDNFNNYPPKGIYNSSSYETEMGLDSNCDIVTYRMPKFYAAVKTALENTASSNNIPKCIRDKITDICTRYKTVNAKNAVILSGFAENIDKYISLWNDGEVNFVKSDKITDFEIDNAKKTVYIYTDSTSEFVPEFICGNDTVTVGAVSCGYDYELRIGSIWTVSVRNSVEINVADNEKISNIGAKPLLTVAFHYTEGVKELTPNSVIIKRADEEKAMRLTPYRVTDKAYMIDSSAFASFSADSDGKISTAKLSDYNVQIMTNGIVTNMNIKPGNISETRTVDRNILPIEYVEGKIIKNVARGKQPDGVNSNVKELFRLTDESGDDYDRYNYARRTNPEQDGYCFRIDLGGFYDIAAAVIESNTERNFFWDNNNSQYGFSKYKTDFMNDTDIICQIGNGGLVKGQRTGVIFDKDKLPRYRYFLGGPNENRDVSGGELLLGDVYVYAYVNENSVPAKEFDFTEFNIEHSENSVWGAAETDGSDNVGLVLAMYKNGVLQSVKSDSGKQKLRTPSIDIPEDWTDFPKKSDKYEVKMFALSGLDTMIPYAEPKDNIIPQISCWGDSYTYKWPEKLQDLLSGKAEVYNLGISKDSAADTAARQGGVPIVLSESVELNGNEPVKVSLKSSGGELNYYLNLYKSLNDFSGEINPCEINGVTGTLSYRDGEYYFGDYTADNTVLPKGAKLVTNQEKKHKNDIQIIMTGNNGGFGKSVDEWAVLEQKMVKSIGRNQKRYLVMSLPSNTFKNKYTNSSNTYKKMIFGDNFLNLYEKFTDIKCLKRYNIELTQADIAEINNGGLPPSLLNESGSYLNDKGFDLLSRMVYDKLIDLGYITYAK